AFVGGLAAVGLVYAVASRLRGHDPLLALVLTGVVIGSLLGSVIALLKYLADPYNQLPAITFWLLGSLSSISSKDLAVAAPLAVGTLCRTIAPIEVPPGVLTALIGTPFFLWLFALARRSW